jgi:hypothetical protein
MDVRDGQRFTTDELDVAFGLALRVLIETMEAEGSVASRLAELKAMPPDERREVAVLGVAGANLPNHLKPIHAEGARLAITVLADLGFEEDGRVRIPAEAAEIAPSLDRILGWGPKGA